MGNVNDADIIDHVNILSSQDILDGEMFPPDTNDYSKVKKAFKNGDWVVAMDGQINCVQAFDMDSDCPQPFACVDSTDSADFRFATKEEIAEAKRQLAPMVEELKERAAGELEMEQEAATIQ